MAITRLQLYQEYCAKVTNSLIASRIDAAVATSSQEAAILTNIKTDLVTALESDKATISAKKVSSTTSFDSQIAALDTQIADVEAVT